MSAEKQPPKPTSAPAQKAETFSPTGELVPLENPSLAHQLLQRARTAPQSLSPAQVLQLQRTVGNRKVAHLLGQQQRNAPTPSVQRQPSSEEPLQPEAPAKSTRGGLPMALQAKMERALNADFSGVKIYPNSDKATDVAALAYTKGEEIHFAPGQFQPDNPTGQALVGHELTHVIQQRAGRVQPTHTLENGVAINADPALEQEADRVGQQAAQSGYLPLAPQRDRATAAPSGVIQGAFTYSATAILERGGADAQTADKFQVNAVNLPELQRPPTQFGNKQMAHSVSWTLLRKAYSAIQSKTPKLNAKQYIEQYLSPDWAGLAHQKGIKADAAQQEFNGYLEKYKAPYFSTLAAATHSILEWHELLQEITSDYFIALNLAPLSTHLGFTSKKGGASEGIKESQPSGHGEPAANSYFTDLEKDPPAAVTPLIAATVLKHANAYWDVGVEMEGGISNATHLALVWNKYATAFSRAYPVTWTKFGAFLKKEIGDKTVLKGSRAAVAPGSTTVGAIVPIDYSARLTLTMADAKTLTAENYTLKKLVLPDDRPPTKYGPIGQKSHTVSWTVVLKGLRNATQGQPLLTALRYLWSKWKFLEEQDWDGMIASTLITPSDFKGKKPTTQMLKNKNLVNQRRLQEAKKLIPSNIATLEKALGNEAKSDTDWVSMIQSSVSHYIEAYQSAPLTTYKASSGRATGHGEPESNRVFGELTRDIASSLGIDWLVKFQALFLGSRWNGSDPTDADKAQPLITKINDEEALEDDEMATLKAIVIKELALNYLDAQWGAVKKGGGWELATAPKEMAMICYEWEESLKAAYPHVWAKYKSVFEGYVERLQLSPELKSQQAVAKTTTVALLGEAGTMKEWMTNRRTAEAYQRGLIAAKSGDSATNPKEHEGYNQAKGDYAAGLAAVQGGDKTMAGRAGVQDAKKEYLAGLAEIQGKNETMIGTVAFRQAKKEYREGIVAMQAKNQTATRLLAKDSAKSEFQKGWLSIQSGNTAMDGTLAFNEAKVTYEYLRGLNSIKGGNAVLDGSVPFNAAKSHYSEGLIDIRKDNRASAPGKPGYNQAKQEYNEGILAIRGGNATETGTTAAVTAKRDYKAGVAAAQAGQVAGTGGNAIGHADYLAGVAAAHAGQVAGTGGNATGHADYLAGAAAAHAGQVAGTGGNATGHAAYLAGVAAAHAGQAAGTGGNARGHAAYLAGVAAANLGQAAGTGGNATGHAAYLAGVAAAHAGQAAGTGGNATGHAAYLAGVAAAQAGGIGLIGGHTTGHAAYLAGVAAARASQAAGVGGRATGHADYLAGIVTAQAGGGAGNVGHAQGHADYQQGVADGNNPAIPAAVHANRAGYMAGYTPARQARLLAQHHDDHNAAFNGEREADTRRTKRVRTRRDG